MKKTFIFFSLFFFAVVTFSQTVPQNKNFENWIDLGTNGDSLVKWNSAIWYDAGVFGMIRIPFAEQSTDAFQGDYAAKLETKEESFTGMILPGIIQLGKFDLEGDGMPIYGGVPFSERPLGLSVFAKYFPADNDTAFVMAYLTKYNGTSTDTIGLTFYPLTDIIPDYTELLMPIIYESEDAPDTLNIVIISTNPLNMKVGSTMYVDSLQLLYEMSAFPTLALEATQITETSFTANWIPSPYVSDYFFDLATDSNFVSIIPDFDNISVDTFNFDITLPEAYFNYENLFYRVRVNYNDTATSINSNVVKVIKGVPINIEDKINEFKNFTIENNTINLSNVPLNSEILIYDILGKIYFSTKTNSTEISIPIINSGIYILEIKNKNEIWRAKFTL
ncbi:MAG: T9SS type A sorting domain-containing protein [Bacteroidales bacterium]|nr:T9SS type A sorting domain-containing protein [Bacteroidales bacterium]